MSKLSDIGLIGLAVMGENLVLNMESKGFTVSVFNRSTQKVDNFISGKLPARKLLELIQLKSLSELLNVREK